MEKKVHQFSVKAVSDQGVFVLSVSNAGRKIPNEKLNNLFKPFNRGDHQPNSQGLGLGLYIAQEIATAHGGVLKATSTDEQTCFTLTLRLFSA